MTIPENITADKLPQALPIQKDERLEMGDKYLIEISNDLVGVTGKGGLRGIMNDANLSNEEKQSHIDQYIKNFHTLRTLNTEMMQALRDRAQKELEAIKKEDSEWVTLDKNHPTGNLRWLLEQFLETQNELQTAKRLAEEEIKEQTKQAIEWLGEFDPRVAWNVHKHLGERIKKEQKSKNEEVTITPVLTPSLELTKIPEHVQADANAAIQLAQTIDETNPLRRINLASNGKSFYYAKKDTQWTVMIEAALITQPDWEFYLWEAPSMGTRRVFRLDSNKNVIGYGLVDTSGKWSAINWAPMDKDGKVPPLDPKLPQIAVKK